MMSRRKKKADIARGKEEHVPDNLPRRKDTSLPAPIVPHYAKTRNASEFGGTRPDR